MSRLIINDLNNWSPWEAPLHFPGKTARAIHLEINCEKQTVLRVKHGRKKESISFVGVIGPGKTELRLNLSGDVVLLHESEGEVWFYNPSGRNERRVSPEPVSFTGPMNRLVRDPALEKMVDLMRNTMFSQMQARERAMQNQIEQLRAEVSKGSSVDHSTGEVLEDGPDNNGATGEGAPSPAGTTNGGGTSGGEAADTEGAGEGQGPDPAAPTADAK